ncbi:MAG: TIGR02281 family clan AA aspartic protease [Pseudomonadota bacterium]
MDDDTQLQPTKLDILVLVGGCIGMFLGVFYFDKVSAFVSQQVASFSAAGTRVATSQPAPDTVLSDASTTAPAESSRNVVFLKADQFGQFYADAYINGRRINVLVDTGASHVSLSYEDAERLGLFLTDRDFTKAARTANGVARVAPVRIDRIRIGDVMVRNIDGFVGQEGIEFPTLLGMSFLRKLDRMSVKGRQLELVQ